LLEEIVDSLWILRTTGLVHTGVASEEMTPLVALENVWWLKWHRVGLLHGRSREPSTESIETSSGRAMRPFEPHVLITGHDLEPSGDLLERTCGIAAEEPFDRCIESVEAFCCDRSFDNSPMGSTLRSMRISTSVPVPACIGTSASTTTSAADIRPRASPPESSPAFNEANSR
jgi:hypothetical protein